MRLLFVGAFAPLREAIDADLHEDGHSVDVAVDDSEGWRYASTHQYEMIILDEMLPGMCGLTMLQRLRQRGNRTPVLLLTAADRVDDATDGFIQGADASLTKPFTCTELLARIIRVQQRTHPIPDPCVRFDDLDAGAKVGPSEGVTPRLLMNFRKEANTVKLLDRELVRLPIMEVGIRR